jgi:hypothetical protein
MSRTQSEVVVGDASSSVSQASYVAWPMWPMR